MRANKVLKILVGCLVGLLASCAQVNPGSSSSSSGGGGGGGVTTPSVFSVGITTSWEADPANTPTTWATCEVTTTSGALSGTTRLNTCSAVIPEGQLYFSKLHLNLTIAAGHCDLINFHPYYYVRSLSAMYQSPGSALGATTDCHEAMSSTPSVTPSKECYDGPAIDVAPSFPTNRGIYQLASTSTTVAYDIDSANTKRQARPYDTGNLWAANLISLAARAAGFADTPTPGKPGGVGVATGNQVQRDLSAGQFVDYTFDCHDVYYEDNYDLTITVSQDNGATDNFVDWATTP